MRISSFLIASKPGIWAAFGQGMASTVVGAGGFGMSARSDGKTATVTYNFCSTPRAYFAVTGAPYSGTLTSQSVRTLADGTHITHNFGSDVTTYRDSPGRVRTERPLFPAMAAQGGKPQIAMEQVDDPVGGYRYVPDSQNRVARMPLQAGSSGPPRVGSVAGGTHMGPNGIVTTTEPLGTQAMFGVSVTGTRNTTVYPAGSNMGNDKPVTGADGSPSTMSIPDLSIHEPAAALFQIPAGYRVVDETGSFTIMPKVGP